MESIWQKTATPLDFDSLNGDTATDVLIVGGGIAGILCAYKLKNAGVDCILAEADRICSGITGYTTAKITIAHGLIYDKLIRSFGKAKARMYLDAQKSALDEYSQLCRDMDCDYETKDSYVYSQNNRRKIEKEISALSCLGEKAEFEKTTELPFEVVGAVCIRNQAQFNPLKFLYTIAKDLPVYENTKVVELGPHKAVTNRGVIRYRKLIIATHFPILNKHGLYSLKLYQHRSYVLVLKGAQSIKNMYVDQSDTGLSFRACGDLLFLGGGGHRTGKQGGCWQELEVFSEAYFPKAEIVGKWATQDCMTLDSVPYIGQYSGATPQVFVATGFNKWGMTNAMVAANVLCDLIKEKQNPFAKVFSPSRSILSPKLAVNAFESAVGLLTPTTPRCPHLGCALKYNPAEHTWDCPCHGSRFTESGRLINNPATDDHKSINR